MDTIEVRLTDEHIRQGQRGVADSCPVALALIAAGYDLMGFGVTTGRVIYPLEGYEVGGVWRRRAIHSNRRGLFQFVKNFDAGLPVQPGTLILGGEGDVDYWADYRPEV